MNALSQYQLNSTHAGSLGGSRASSGHEDRLLSRHSERCRSPMLLLTALLPDEPAVPPQLHMRGSPALAGLSTLALAQPPNRSPEMDMEQTVTLPLNLVLEAVNALCRMGEALRHPEN